MNEMLETFRDASAADLQAAGQAIARHEPQIFCGRCTVCTVQHKFWDYCATTTVRLLRQSGLIR